MSIECARMPFGGIVQMFEFKWSDAEKVIARQAFDMALRNECRPRFAKSRRELRGSVNPSNYGNSKTG